MLDLWGLLWYNGFTSEGLFFCAKNGPKSKFRVYCMCFALMPQYVVKSRYSQLLREAQFAENQQKYFP